MVFIRILLSSAVIGQRVPAGQADAAAPEPGLNCSDLLSANAERPDDRRAFAGRDLKCQSTDIAFQAEDALVADQAAFLSEDFPSFGVAAGQPIGKDAFALRARRIEIPASITGLPFYQKMGYSFKNGNDQIDEEQLYRLEKIRF
jgi:hypothetical protein